MSKATPAVIKLLHGELDAVKQDEAKVKQVVDDKCKPMIRTLTSEYAKEEQARNQTAATDGSADTSEADVAAQRSLSQGSPPDEVDSKRMKRPPPPFSTGRALSTSRRRILLRGAYHRGCVR